MSQNPLLTKPDKAALKQQFEREGYLVIPNVFQTKQILEMREALLAIFEERIAKGLKVSATLQDTLEDVLVAYPQFIEPFCHERLLESVECLLGENAILTPDSSGLREYYGKLHTDTTGTEADGYTFHHEPDFQLATVGLYLQDNNEYGGGLFVVPGSHKKSDPYVEIARKYGEARRSKYKQLARKYSLGLLYNYDRQFAHHPRGFDIPSRAGDFILFNVKIIHRASYAKVKQPSPHGGKLALFSRFSANNRHAQNWIDYLRASTMGGYNYLHQPRDIAQIQQAFGQRGIVAL